MTKRPSAAEPSSRGDAGPGLAKVRRPPLLAWRQTRLVAVVDRWWSDTLDHADVMSEGGVVSEAGGRVYYGTTSVACALDHLPRVADDRADAPAQPLAIERLAAILAVDPHVRTRALRIAQREAAARAGASLGVLHGEVVIAAEHDPAPGRIVVTIDVSARLASAVQGAASD